VTAAAFIFVPAAIHTIGGGCLFSPYDYYITPEEYEEAERNGISRKHVNYRIRQFGWGKQKAITTPVN
jgi:hypothetical protein